MNKYESIHPFLFTQILIDFTLENINSKLQNIGSKWLFECFACVILLLVKIIELFIVTQYLLLICSTYCNNIVWIPGNLQYLKNSCLSDKH